MRKARFCCGPGSDEIGRRTGGALNSRIGSELSCTHTHTQTCRFAASPLRIVAHRMWEQEKSNNTGRFLDRPVQICSKIVGAETPGFGGAQRYCYTSPAGWNRPRAACRTSSPQPTSSGSASTPTRQPSSSSQPPATSSTRSAPMRSSRNVGGCPRSRPMTAGDIRAASGITGCMLHLAMPQLGEVLWSAMG